MAPSGIKLHLPESVTAIAQKKDTYVRIDKKQDIYLDEILIKPSLLSKKIKALLAKNFDLTIILSADKSTPYDLIMGLLDALRLAGCYDVVLETSKPLIHEK